jgi:hypothetical protein
MIFCKETSLLGPKHFHLKDKNFNSIAFFQAPVMTPWEVETLTFPPLQCPTIQPCAQNSVAVMKTLPALLNPGLNLIRVLEASILIASYIPIQKHLKYFKIIR